MSKTGAVHLFTGEDEFSTSAAARELVNRLVPDSDQALGLEIVDGRADNADGALVSLKRCREALLTPGFLLAQGKLVWWRDVSFLADGQAEEVRDQVKAFAALLADTDLGGAVLLVTTPKIDRRSAFFKLCSERFDVREFGLPEKAYLAERQARDTLRLQFRACGLKAGSEAEDLFLGRVGNDARRIAGEAEKLALFMGGRTAVTPDDIAAIVSASATSVMWDFQDAIGERNLAGALNIVRELLAQKESPIGIIVAAFSRTRDLLLYRQAIEAGWVRPRDGAYGAKHAEWGGFPPEAEPALTLALKRPPRSVNSFAAGKLAQQAQRYTVAQLCRNQQLVSETHETLVSSSIPQALALELMLVRMMG